MASTAARPPLRATVADLADNAGTVKKKMLVIQNTNMFTFKHPNHYKRIRKANRSQAISKEPSTEAPSVRPGSGHKRQAASDKLKGRDCPDDKTQDVPAASNKPEDLPPKSQ